MCVCRYGLVPSKYLMTVMIIVMMISFYYFARHVSLRHTKIYLFSKFFVSFDVCGSSRGDQKLSAFTISSTFVQLLLNVPSQPGYNQKLLALPSWPSLVNL